MPRSRSLVCALPLLLASFCCQAGDFAFEVAAPKFRVSIPGVPPMKMETHPQHAAQPHLRYLGSQGPYTVSIITPTAAAGMTAIECASATVRSMAARQGMPPSAEMYKAKLDDNTFVAMYAAAVGGAVQLHAHFLSAAGGTHCIEVHASKMSESPDDVESWFRGFTQARIESR
jgi:hypothetical protein